MDHVAIMKKSWGLLPKIENGQKIIESRWYQNKVKPWGIIKPGDTIYFKNSGEPVTLKTGVLKVLQFDKLNPYKVNKILSKYGKMDGLGKNCLKDFYNLFCNKNYCLLVFLKNPQKITPFNINKTGFGSMSAWLSIPNIEEIKAPSLTTL